MRRDDPGSWVARGAAFGVGLTFGLPVLLGVGVLLLLFTATHWYMLLAIPIVMVAGFLSAMVKTFRANHERNRLAARTPQQKHLDEHTKWCTGCQFCDESFPATAKWYREMQEDLRRRREAGESFGNETIAERYPPPKEAQNVAPRRAVGSRQLPRSKNERERLLKQHSEFHYAPAFKQHESCPYCAKGA